MRAAAPPPWMETHPTCLNLPPPKKSFRIQLHSPRQVVAKPGVRRGSDLLTTDGQEVFGVGLRIVVRHIHGRLAHVVNCRVVGEQVIRSWLWWRKAHGAGTLAELAHSNTRQVHVLVALLVGARVGIADGIACFHGKVHPLAIGCCILAAVSAVEGVAIDLVHGDLVRAVEEPVW